MQNTSSRRLTAEVTHIPGTGWNGLRVFDPLGGQEACWEDLTEDETRLLKLVEIEDARMASSVTEMLMGSEVPPRRSFIYENATEAELDI